MSEVILTGEVQADGRLVLDEIVDLPPGKVEIVVRRKSFSVSLEEAKRQIAKGDTRTDDQRAAAKRIYQEMAEGVDGLDLPEDYVDELDHYLYGTPKRGQEES